MSCRRTSRSSVEVLEKSATKSKCRCHRGVPAPGCQSFCELSSWRATCGRTGVCCDTTRTAASDSATPTGRNRETSFLDAVKTPVGDAFQESASVPPETHVRVLHQGCHHEGRVARRGITGIHVHPVLLQEAPDLAEISVLRERGRLTLERHDHAAEGLPLYVPDFCQISVERRLVGRFVAAGPRTLVPPKELLRRQCNSKLAKILQKPGDIITK